MDSVLYASKMHKMQEKRSSFTTASPKIKLQQIHLRPQIKGTKIIKSLIQKMSPKNSMWCQPLNENYATLSFVRDP